MSVVSLEAALALREMGMPATGDGGFVRYWVRSRHDLEPGEEESDAWGLDYLDVAERVRFREYAFAPDQVTALDWLERERGYAWGRWPGHLEGEAGCSWWANKPGPTVDSIARGNPDELIISIAAHWRDHEQG